MTPDRQSARMRDICALAPVIPVIVIDDIAHAQPLARALVAGGLPVLEVTLRTPVALDAIRAMSTVPGAVVGAGAQAHEDRASTRARGVARVDVHPPERAHEVGDGRGGETGEAAEFGLGRGAVAVQGREESVPVRRPQRLLGAGPPGR